jgi:hypothetical protein
MFYTHVPTLQIFISFVLLILVLMVLANPYFILHYQVLQICSGRDEIGAYTSLIRFKCTNHTWYDLLHFLVAMGSYYVPHLHSIQEILVSGPCSNILLWFRPACILCINMQEL